jgi:thiamine biosynthesis lipoprotein
MNKTTLRNMLWVVALLLASTWIIVRHQRAVPYETIGGTVFGTFYKIVCQCDANLRDTIEGALRRVDFSLSPFNKASTISAVNRNEAVVVDSMFAHVFRRSMEVSRATHGAFDITVAPLVNAWGFGFKESLFPDSTMVDSLLQFTGYTKVTLSEAGHVVKQDPRIQLNCSAIAKGYGVDVVAQLLRDSGVDNFMVDIGGEVAVHGKNQRGEPWNIGINKPIDNPIADNSELQITLRINQGAIATSGNYRYFYYKEGKKYAHTIDPATGYPVQHSLLSATVIAHNCMTADAYATAFMVLGVEKARKIVEAHPELEVYFIYADEKGENRTYASPGMKRYYSD